MFQSAVPCLLGEKICELGRCTTTTTTTTTATTATTPSSE